MEQMLAKVTEQWKSPKPETNSSGMGTLPETNRTSPLKIDRLPQKETRKYSNHPFSGVFAVSFREGKYGCQPKNRGGLPPKMDGL